MELLNNWKNLGKTRQFKDRLLLLPLLLQLINVPTSNFRDIAVRDITKF